MSERGGNRSEREGLVKVGNALAASVLVLTGCAPSQTPEHSESQTQDTLTIRLTPEDHYGIARDAAAKAAESVGEVADRLGKDPDGRTETTPDGMSVTIVAGDGREGLRFDAHPEAVNPYLFVQRDKHGNDGERITDSLKFDVSPRHEIFDGTVVTTEEALDALTAEGTLLKGAHHLTITPEGEEPNIVNGVDLSDTTVYWYGRADREGNVIPDEIHEIVQSFGDEQQ